jgi:hypothetical protein
MNNILTYIAIGTFCFLGTKLKVINSEFTEVLPGIASADVVTRFEIDVKSNGNKKIDIQSIWVKNVKATWSILDGSKQSVDSFSDKNVYTIKGEIRVKGEKAISRSKSEVVIESTNYEEDFILNYKIGDSESIKVLKIDKIENMKQLRMQ